MSDRVIETLQQHTAVLEQSLVQYAEQLELSARQLAQTFASGGHLVIVAAGTMMGVGDTIAQAFMHNPEIERPPLPALSLSGNAGLIAALSSANAFEQFYTARIQATARSGDMVMFITAEVSAALLAGVEAARELNCATLVLSAADAQPWIEAGADTVIALEAPSLARGAEALLYYGNVMCEMVEAELFGF
ncbi:MAG: hypothetical protein RBR43_05890 [Desulfuromonadaceae bacterium]|nr:hypothetical protein [Desulfuromonas sp.]MDY0185393.1 hypothetical protein [Desulfuromonadaceae bacterium]